MAIAGDDDVAKYGDVERFQCVGDDFCHVDICGGGGRITGRVVMNQQYQEVYTSIIFGIHFNPLEIGYPIFQVIFSIHKFQLF